MTHESRFRSRSDSLIFFSLFVLIFRVFLHDQVDLLTMLEPGQIRLLHIAPGDGPRITCTTSIVPLNSAPPYDALSYTWGLPNPSQEIELCGEACQIRSNLQSALQNLRHKDQEQTIWIDAICINQNDDAERTSQVKMMADIYLRARHVYIWIGDETEFDHMAFALLEQLNDVFKQHGRIDLDFQQEASEVKMNPGFGLPNTDAQDWVALGRLFRRPYFERVWVIQEVVRATMAVLVCGSLRINWEVVNKLARSLRKGGSLGTLEYEEYAPGIVSVNAMAELKETSISLLPLLVKTRGYKSTESVDKLFAVMNLASSQNVGIKVDYSMPALEVWERLAIYELSVQKNLLSLSNAGLDSSSQQSWVPDWSLTAEHRGCLALYGMEHFKASGETILSLSVSDDLQILKITGFIVDSTAVVAPNIYKYSSAKEISGPLVNITEEEDAARSFKIMTELQNIAKIAASAFKYDEGQSRELELIRTLGCDILATGEPVDIASADKVYRYWAKTATYYPFGVQTDIETKKRELDALLPTDIQTESFMHSFVLFDTGRSLCTTTSGDLGRVPFGTKPGDLICIFKGGIVPYLLRLENGYYKLIGECFINGIMYGEAMKREDLVEQEFEIK